MIVAISGKRGTGKTTLANELRFMYSFNVVNLADPLKAMCREHFGLTSDQTDGVLKEQPTQYRDLSLPGRSRFLTPRDIMIHIGKSFRMVDPDFWVKRLLSQLSDDRLYVVPDVRFKNELGQLKAKGAFCVRLERDESLTGANINDPSEMELDDYSAWDLKIPKEENVDMSDMVRIAELVYLKTSEKHGLAEWR